LITQLMLQLEEAAYNKTIADDPSLASDRGFSSVILQQLSDIQFYGCWCFLDGDWDYAKGPVQDYLDQQCKILVQNYRCLVMDALDRGDTCDPHTQPYDPYNLFLGSEDVVGECEQRNTGVPNEECAIGLCKADGSFTLELFALMFQQGGIAASQPPYDPTMTHVSQNGNFNHATECKYDYKGAGRSEKECCGKYPERFPFKTFGGDKACCEGTPDGGKTYSTLSMQCCLPSLPDFPNESVEDINDPCPVST